jgi:hypothetical protein
MALCEGVAFLDRKVCACPVRRFSIGQVPMEWTGIRTLQPRRAYHRTQENGLRGKTGCHGQDGIEALEGLELVIKSEGMGKKNVGEK